MSKKGRNPKGSASKMGTRPQKAQIPIWGPNPGDFAPFLPPFFHPNPKTFGISAPLVPLLALGRNLRLFASIPTPTFVGFSVSHFSPFWVKILGISSRFHHPNPKSFGISAPLRCWTQQRGGMDETPLILPQKRTTAQSFTPPPDPKIPLFHPKTPQKSPPIPPPPSHNT